MQNVSVPLQAIGRHRNVVRLLGAADDGTSFIMERAAGDLQQAIRRWRRKLPLAYVRQWGRDILTGVERIHDMGVLHQERARRPDACACYPENVACAAAILTATAWAGRI